MAETSTTVVTKLVNITSGESMIDVREDFAALRIQANSSNVRINPGKQFVNITVAKPTMQLNISNSQNQVDNSIELTSDQSEIFVTTNRSEKAAEIKIDSGLFSVCVLLTDMSFVIIEKVEKTASRKSTNAAIRTR